MEDSPSLFSHPLLAAADEPRFNIPHGVGYETFAVDSENGAPFDPEDDRYLEILLQRETSLGFPVRQELDDKPSCSSVVRRGEGNESAHRDAVAWILNTSAALELDFVTAYLSITYFDRFIRMRAMAIEKQWAIRLLSVASLSLAAKMLERRAPPLARFPTEFSFDCKAIQRMELLVLNALGWRMHSITPFAFIPHFIAKFCNESAENVVPKVADLILAMIKVIAERNTMDHRPSIVAAAAVLMAVERGLTRIELVLKMNSAASYQRLITEDVFRCYSLMEEIEARRSAISPNPCPSRSGGLARSSLLPGAGNRRRRRRRRLKLNNRDQYRGIPGGD